MEKIWVGTISHEYGSNMYASRTQAGLLAQVADFCRSYWAEHGDETPPTSDDMLCIDTYFEDNQDESLDYGETEIK